MDFQSHKYTDRYHSLKFIIQCPYGKINNPDKSSGYALKNKAEK